MASAYSTPKQFDNYVQPINLELVNFVLGSKEQKFNYNIAKVEQTLSEFGQLGLVRDQDKEYLADRINNMVSSMGDIENMDWSDSNIERQITTGIRGAIDDKVRKDVQLSRQYTNYLKQVQTIKEKEPEKYSDINFAMGLKNAGADKWVQGESEEFDNLQYTPYIDVKASKNEYIKEMIKTHGNEKVVELDPDQNGIIVRKTIKGLSEEEAGAMYDASLTAQERMQLQMEADYNYGNASPDQQEVVLEKYNSNLRKESKSYADLAEKYKIAASKLEGQEKEEYLQVAANFEDTSRAISDQVGNLTYQDAYRDSYSKSIRQDIVNSNSFERTTKIERDLDGLRAVKLNAEIMKLGREATEAEQTAAGANLRVTADGGLDLTGDNAIVDNFAIQTMKDMDASAKNLQSVFARETQNPAQFEKLYGISASAYNKKNAKERERFIAQQFEDLDEKGVSLKANGYSPEVIKAYNSYKSSRNAFDSVNNGVKTATDDIAKTSLDAMIEGHKSGGFKVDNYPVKVIRDAVRKGTPFGELKGDEQTAFKVAMIDESIRDSLLDESLLPFLLRNRQELVDSIQDSNIKSQLPSEDTLRTGVEWNTVRGTWNSVAGFVTGDDEQQARGREQLGEGMLEGLRRLSKIFVTHGDDELTELGTNDYIPDLAGGYDPDFVVDGEAVDAADFIRSKYSGALEAARTDAAESASRYSSTYAISLSEGIKEEKRMRDRALSAITLNSPYSMDDFGKDDVEVRYDKATQTLQYTANIKSSVANRMDGTPRRVSSKRIPISEEANVIPELTNRIKTDDDAWSFNSENKSAENLKFTTSGFLNDNERIEAINNMPEGALSEDQISQLQADRTSLGYTSAQLSSLFEDLQRSTASGETREFASDFPKTYQRLLQGGGNFEINYESKHNQGYFMTIDYNVGGKKVNLIPHTPVGRTVDYEEKFLESFQRQRELIEYIAQAYVMNDKDTISKLKEIEQL